MKTDQQKINCLSSDLRNLISEHKLQKLNEEELLRYFSDFMKSAGVNTDITIAVLEKFGDLGKEAALIIKVNEGY